MTEYTDLEQAKMLLRRIKKALQQIRSLDQGGVFEDTEVRFRYEHIDYTLVIALNELRTMIEMWEEDDYD